MLPELGRFALILALCFALLQGCLPLYSYVRRITTPSYFNLSIAAVMGQVCFLSFAMLCLISSFLLNDMSVAYIQEHSHKLLPLLYRVGAAWGGHEGSLLLWCLILSGWTFAFVIFTSIESVIYQKMIMVLGFISSGFIAFLLFTSDPFRRIFSATPLIGDDLTPVLQDPGLIFHPPMLYLGYVGFAIGFAFAIAVLIQGECKKEWARACRPWIILPWSFLSCGIVLGSWWAYRELGWGGWWFWDPVENASLLPWLSATALLHALIVSEKREVFQGWTLLLAIVTFTLSLLGTFLVRSGVLVSVHAFASDPTRGIFLLCYLALIIGGAFACYAARIHRFYRPPQFELFSRETFLLLNTVILLTAVATICLGTLYPILLDAFNAGKISVGEPYFNIVFVPIILPLLFFMGLAPHVNWGQQSVNLLWKKLRVSIISSLLLGFFIPLLLGFPFHVGAFVGIVLGIWIILATLQIVYSGREQKKRFLSYAAMVIAHLGIAMIALGVTVNKSYSEERQVRMSVGETVDLAGYQFTLKYIEKSSQDNYNVISANFAVTKNTKALGTLVAEERIYQSHDQTLSKPGIIANPWRDLYLALGTSFPDNSWSVRIYYKPLVRWIWCGGFLLLLGGFLAVIKLGGKRERKI